MRYRAVKIAAIGYELPAQVATSRELEARLGTVYERLHLQPGQLEALTGIRERRWWPPGQTMAGGATAAGRKALAASGRALCGAICRTRHAPVWAVSLNPLR